MNNTNNILILGDGGRKDILSMFDGVKTQANIFFLLYKYELKNKNPSVYKNYGTIILWENFYNAFELIEKCSLKKIIFLQFGDYNEIALNTAAKINSIPTYMLSHGFLAPDKYDYIKQLSKSDQHLKKTLTKNSLVIKLLLLKNKFYTNTKKRTKGKEKAFMKKYFITRTKNTMLETFDILENDLLKQNYYLCFNNNDKDWYKRKHKIKEKESQFIIFGIPYFDHFCKIKLTPIHKQSVIFIDQPLHEQKLFGWTKKFKIKFLEDLSRNLEGCIINVKTHPLSDLEFWNNIKHINIIKEENWTKTLTHTTIILGFYSTLLLPLAALENKIIFSFENHPTPPPLPHLSEFLTENGVAIQINKCKELKEHLKDIHNLVIKQNEKKPKFIQKWLYKNDGKSKERLTKLILTNETI